MGREIHETGEGFEEDEKLDEDEECVGCAALLLGRALVAACSRLRCTRRFDFPTEAGVDAETWEDPSPDGVLGAHRSCSVCANTSATLAPNGAHGACEHRWAQTAMGWLTRRCSAGKLFVACAEHDAATMLPLLPSATEHLNKLGPEGDTLLHIASLYGYADLVEALLAAGSDPEVKDENGSTPLVRRVRDCKKCAAVSLTVLFPGSMTRAQAVTSTSCAGCSRFARSWCAKWTTMRSWHW